MTDSSIHLHIKDLDLFKNIPDREIARISNSMRFFSLKKGYSIYAEGEATTDLFLLKKGRVKIFKTDQEVKDTILELLLEGDIFGKLELANTPMKSVETATVISNEALVVSIDAKTLADHMMVIPHLAINYSNILVRKLSEIEKKYSYFLKSDIRKRLMTFFVMHAYYEGRPCDNGIEIKSFMTHQEIANFVGTSRQTVTTLIKEIEEKGYLILSAKGSIIIPDIEEMKKMQ